MIKTAVGPAVSGSGWKHSRVLRLGLAAALAAAVVVSAAPHATAVDYGTFTGNLVVSSTTANVGTPITATESATNLGSTQVPFITVGIRRLGFDVTGVVKPRTGICRIAGSATCSSLLLAPNETQSYQLTLVPTATGSYTIQGWTTQPITGRGVSKSVTVTVT